MRRLTTSEFIENVRSVHGDRYDYSRVIYSTSNKPITVICRIHGEFRQKANNHMSGSGCPICAGKKTVTTADFVRLASSKHSNKYDYSLVEYINAHKQVKIICSLHGEFLQTPDKHLTGRGCQTCGGSKRSNGDAFIKKARAKHGNKYDYSLVDYVTAVKKVKIVCLQHGVFMQTPASHFTRSGCPACAENGYRPSKPGTLYYVRFDLPGLQLWKIGITNRKIKERFSRFNVKPVILWQRTWRDGNIAAKEEKRILRGGLYDQYRYNGDPVLHDGNTECFTIDIMQLDNVTRIAQASA